MIFMGNFKGCQLRLGMPCFNKMNSGREDKAK
jgi:hypothetical protein